MQGLKACAIMSGLVSLFEKGFYCVAKVGLGDCPASAAGAAGLQVHIITTLQLLLEQDYSCMQADGWANTLPALVVCGFEA